jgi:hypothetical protein
MLEGRQPLAKALVVAKLDRLSRSLVDFGSIMERAERRAGPWQRSTSAWIPRLRPAR